MNPWLVSLLLRLYPRSWRERYGDEFAALLQSSKGHFRITANVALSALWERIVQFPGGIINKQLSFGAISRKPSAFLPFMMSLSALALVLGDFAIHGIVRQADEGFTAHMWQLLMAAQVPVVLFFAVKWLRRAPKQSLKVLALQAGGALANLALIFFSGVG